MQIPFRNMSAWIFIQILRMNESSRLWNCPSVRSDLLQIGLFWMKINLWISNSMLMTVESKGQGFIRKQETSSTNRLVVTDNKFLNQWLYVNLMTVKSKGQGSTSFGRQSRQGPLVFSGEFPYHIDTSRPDIAASMRHKTSLPLWLNYIHTYMHSMDPYVCLKDSRIWNK